MKLRYFSSVILFFFYSVVCGNTITSGSSGLWETGATWVGGSSPVCGDQVINISAGHKVTISTILDYSACGSNITLNISGELTFQTGKKLKLPCGSVVNVLPGGTITGGGGGGSSNLIEICGTNVWTAGSGTASGPVVFTVGGVGLPIELVYFAGEVSGKRVQLLWQTATELNNNYFTIEKSKDGLNFTSLTQIQSLALGGNSSSALNYEFYDVDPFEGVTYYRLKQTDYDGNFEYGQVVAVNYSGKKDMTFTLYPNPNKGEFIVDFTGLENNHTINVVIMDQQGKKIYESFFQIHASGTNKIEIIPEEKINPGVYICSLILEGIKQDIRIIVN